MSRTYRRRRQRHEYRWVLRDWKWCNHILVPVLIDARSKEGRRAIARFHSDAERTMRSGPPSWYRRIFKIRLRTRNIRQLRRWFNDPEYDPVFHPRHRYSAQLSVP
jgi:hypothetical protein